MTKIKRLVSVILAVLMIFGSVSVAAFAWDATTDDGFNLDITTKIFREVNGEWVETEKVKKGENVKARVYLNTDYYTNSGQLLFFYDSGFFTDSFGTGYETLTVNPYYTSSPYGINGKFISSKSSSNIEDSLVNSGKITSEFANSHEFVFATYSFSNTAKNQMLSSSNWFCEFPLTVKDDASGTGDFFALEETTASASFTRGKINVPKGPFNGYNENVVHMSSWDAVLNYTSQPVTLFTNFVTATFDAGAGEFSDGTSSKYFEGDAGETLTVEEPSRTNFRFAGWKLTGDDDSTASEVTAFPAVSSTYEAVWTSTTASSEVLTFKTEFYRQDSATGEWVATTRVKPGEVVKARLFVDTSYFTNAGEILLFYDNDFFTDSYVTNSPTDLSVNPDPESSASINGVNGKSTKLLSSGNIISGLVSNGYISQSFADSHQAISVSYAFKPSTGKKISGDKWFVEFDLQVRSTASGTGDIFVVEDTIMNSGSGVKAYINLPLSTDGGEPMNSIAMHLWDVNAVIESNPVSTLSSVTFRANGGAFDAADTETYVVNGDIGDAIDASAIPAVSKTGATFMGWVPSTVENPTVDDVVAVPSEIPYDDLILDALWIDEVDITFVLNNGQEPVVQTVTAGDAFVTPEDPELEGNFFVGWTSDSTFKTISGLPDVYPAEDTTYYAVFETNSYIVKYLVLNKDTSTFDNIGEVSVSYGEKIPHIPPYYSVPTGYTISEAYTDASFANLLAEDAKMPAKTVEVYFKTVAKSYDAVFDAGEGTFDDGASTATVSVEYGSIIVAPVAPTRDGYEFAGWSPEVGYMDAEGKTFNAIWTPRTYTATYIVDGAIYETFELACGQNMEKPVPPYVEGYTFKGWTPAVPDTMPASNQVFNAVLEPKTYVATFEAGEGKFADDTVTVTVPTVFNTEIAAPADPTRDGYDFAGWTPVVPAAMPAKDMTFTATWTARDDTPYTVEIYTMDTTGAYGTPDVLNKTGTTDKLVEITTVAPDGFYIDTTDSVLSDTVAADGTTVLKVYLARNEYTISFDANDGVFTDSSDLISGSYYHGAIVSAPVPAREGYTFLGWDKAVSTVAVASVDYVAQWQINQYTITFGDTGDTVIDPITQDYGTAITAPEDPTKEGYTFTGWSEEIPATMPAESKTINAQWQINQYTITFAETGDAVINPITQDYGTAITAPEDPTKVGYTFKGWDVEIPATMPAGNMTITGQWEINQYTITFGDTGDTVIDPITQDYGTAVTAPKDPTKEGYTFTGWSEEIPATMPAESKTINAQWQINQYTITFAETGDAVINPITQDYGTAITAPEDPTKVGYTFKGWDVEIPATMPAGDMTITGQWEINQYTITFANTGDTVIAPITQEYDTEITAPGNPAKEGYAFAGWVDENGDPTTIPDYMPAENLTITATWNVRSYPVRYTVDGETYYGPTVTAYGSTIVEPDVPTKPGYAFAGWLDADGKKPSDYGTMPAKALEFIAQWAPNANVGYIIEVYEMGTDGTYPSTPTITYTMKDGVVGDTREFEASVPAGFVLDTTNSVLSGTIPATGTLVLKAYYERNSHTLKTVVDGVETDTTVYYGAVIPAQAAPVKEGYDFAGWVDVNGDPTVIPAVMPDSDVTVYASFTLKSYTAEYIVDGVVIQKYDVEFGAVIPQPADPDVEGMEFKGWTPAVPDTMPSSDLTVTAVLEAKTYTATFNSNDGEFAGNSTSKTVNVKFGEAIVFAEVPVRIGYTFAGWAPSVPASMPAQNLTFEAQWTAEGDTPYKILTYTMDTAGNYGTPVETSKTGKSGEIVEVFTSATEGFTVASQSTLSAVLAADGSTVLTVYLARNQYTISFNANGGSITGSADTTVSAQYYHGALVSAPSVEREGYTFKGWNPSLNITATGNANYAAQWEINEYTITFDTDGGSAVAPITQDYGTAINAPADPVKEGYTFKGWSETIPATMPAGDMAVTAQWEINSYKVTWNVDGVLTEEDYEYGATIVEPEAPVKAGYVFAGWAPNVPATMPARNLEFVATWTEATDTAYTVELYVMDETGNYVKSVQNLTGTTNAEVEAKYTVQTGFVLNTAKSVLTGTVAADGSLVLKVYLDRQSYKFSTCVDGVITSTTDYLYGETVLTPSEPSKTGYTFSGWVNAVTGETVDFTNVVTMPAADMTVNATWTVNSYTVTFRDRGVILKTDTYNYGEVITVISDPVRDGYTFAGWSPAVPATMPANNINTNATWTANEYSIIFDTDGGTEIAPITQAVGTDIFDIPDDPTKEGYTFAGWSEEIPATMPVGGMTITATWEPIEYTITFGDTGDTVIAPITQDYGTAITAPEDPTKEGYTFTGWSEEIPATMPAENKTINAQWEINQYTITFDTNGGSAVAPITQDYGTAITAPENPTKQGYTFAGWSEAVPATMPAENKTLTASWTVNTYTVTWNNEGTKTTADYNYGDTIVLPETPVKDGYTFFGWFDENGLQPSNYVTMPAKDIEFEARFTPNGNSSYIIEVYEMGTDGTFASTPSSAYTHSDGIVGNTKTVTPDVPYGFTLNTEKSVLSGVIPSTGTLVLKVYYNRNLHTLTTVVDGLEKDYDYYYNAVVTPVADPVKDGYVFAGWVDADDNATAIPTVMPDSDVKVYATWTNDSYTATFNAGEGVFGDGSSTKSTDVPFGGDITPPATDPTREGYDFGGWATADDPETPVTDFGTMGVGDREYVAIWTKSSFKITFYNYKPADGGPNAPTVKYALATADYKYGETIDFPTDPSFDYYIFLGWSETEGDSTNLITSADTITMPAHDYNLYAVYEKVKVMLIPKNDTCTTVIDRNGGTVDDYTDDSEWYVYGLEEYLTENMLLDEYIDVQGDGRIEIIPVDVNFGPYRGTGTIINVYDRNGTVETTDDRFVESFRVIIFGDLNGDAIIRSVDSTIVDKEVSGLTSWHLDYSNEYCAYMVKAADVSKDTFITSVDATLIDRKVIGIATIDQVTGLAS